MEEKDIRLFYGDTVSVTCPESNATHYGLVLYSKEFKPEVPSNNKQTVEVMWHPDGRKEMILANKVTLVDRPFTAGDTVYKYDGDKPSRIGYCESVNVSSTVRVINTSRIIENVCGEELNSKNMLKVGNLVVYDLWFGEIFDVIYRVIFMSDDGSIFAIEDPFQDDFININENTPFDLGDSVFCQFHKGQKVKCHIGTLTNAIFRKKTDAMDNALESNDTNILTKCIEIAVLHVEVFSVQVKWSNNQCYRSLMNESTPPPNLITGKSLEKLYSLSLRKICLGDHKLYTIKPTDVFIKIEDYIKKLLRPSDDIKLPQMKGPKHRFQNNVGQRQFTATHLEVNDNIRQNEMKTQGLKSNPVLRKIETNKQCYHSIVKTSSAEDLKIVVEVIFCKTVVNVIWEDGTKDIGVASTDLYPVKLNTFSLECKPGIFVKDKSNEMYQNDVNVYGMIDCACKAERSSSVRIKWFEYNITEPFMTSLISNTRESKYKLAQHSVFNIKLGTFVVTKNVISVDSSSNVVFGKYLSVGKDGKVLVKLSNGSVRSYWPPELFIIKNHFTYQQPINICYLDPKWLSLNPNTLSMITDETIIENKFFESLRKGSDGIDVFIRSVYYPNSFQDVYEDIESSIEQIMTGLNIASYFTNEIVRETIKMKYEVIVQILFEVVDKFIDKLYEKLKDEEESYENTNFGSKLMALKNAYSKFLETIELHKSPANFVKLIYE